MMGSFLFLVNIMKNNKYDRWLSKYHYLKKRYYKYRCCEYKNNVIAINPETSECFFIRYPSGSVSKIKFKQLGEPFLFSSLS